MHPHTTAAAMGGTVLSVTRTFTFLFTDIEGSTRLWDRYPDAMHAALARHDRLMKGAIELRGGRVFKTIGDAFCAVFPAPSAAAGAALAAQRALAGEDWQTIGGALRVRMALHTGEAEERNGDYFGFALSRIARLVDAAYGQQILLSEATRDLLVSGEALPPDVTLRDLGTHRLKDLAQPERLYQLQHPDLPGPFPPVRSLDAQPNNLPQQLTRFVGREAAMADVLRLLKTTRLLTLTGVGGGGKTRLALQAAADQVGKRPDGVWFVDLAAGSDPERVSHAAAAALGVREVLGQSLEATLRDYLQNRDLLLVLDNAEHLIEVCARLATMLLISCPALRLLVTSREPLGVPGEIAWPVPPLSLPETAAGGIPVDPEMLARSDSVRLFVDRATAAAPRFALTPANGPAVAWICRRLDGIPLAIELAAARVKVLTPDQILARLDDRFRLLTGGSRTALPRQQTLRALIDWSYDLLSFEEQTLLRRLSVFAGGWTLEAAEAVCADADGAAPLPVARVLEALAHLVDKSLVVTDEAAAAVGEPRYRFLETIRQYALEKLHESGEAAARADRHRDWFVRWAESAEPALRGPLQAAWFDCLEAEHDNLRTALARCRDGAPPPGGVGAAVTGLRIAAALSRFWYVRGHLSEGREWLESFLTLTEGAAGVDPALRGKALHAAGSLARDQGDPAQAAARYAEALAFRRAIGDRHGTESSRQQLGAVALDRGDYGTAAAYFEGTLGAFRELGDPRGEAISLGHLGALAKRQGDYAAAARLLTQSLELSRQYGETWGTAMALGNLGHLARYAGDTATASARYEEALRLYRETGDARGIALALDSLAHAALQQGDTPRALTLHRDSLALYQKVGDRRGIAAVLLGLAAALAVDGQPSRAARLGGASEALREAVGWPLPPLEQEQLDRHLARSRSALGEAAFAAAWREGRALTAEQALAEAMRRAADPAAVGNGAPPP